jgi:AcrR family transcriptional regulator
VAYKEDTHAAILRSARQAIFNFGILGLRVADVAAASNTSITQIYRFFRNRDGLLASVLGDIYDEQSRETVDAYMSRLPACRQLTIDDLVDNMPAELTPDLIKFHELRLQILAASVHNSDLRERLKMCSQNMVTLWNDDLDVLEEKMAPGEEFDRRFFTMVLSQQTPYYRTLFEEKFFTVEEFRDFLREKLRI